jgi:hypothetical protein
LKALKTATESYLETSISTTEIVVLFPVTKVYYKTLRSACSAVSLHVPYSALDTAGIFATRAYGVCSKHFRNSTGEIPLVDNPQQIILTVEYSRAALTALVVHEDSGVFEVRRVMHDTDLAFDQLRGGLERDIRMMETLLRELVCLPISDSGNG